MVKEDKLVIEYLLRWWNILVPEFYVEDFAYNKLIMNDTYQIVRNLFY